MSTDETVYEGRPVMQFLYEQLQNMHSRPWVSLLNESVKEGQCKQV